MYTALFYALRGRKDFYYCRRGYICRSVGLFARVSPGCFSPLSPLSTVRLFIQVGPLAFGGMNMKIEDLEFRLNKGGVPTDVKENPRPPVEDVMMKTLKQSNFNAEDDSEDDNDW